MRKTPCFKPSCDYCCVGKNLTLLKERFRGLLYTRAKIVFSTNCAGTTSHPYAKKNESRHKPYTINKINSNGHRTNCEMQNYKTPKKITKEKI